MGRLLGRGHSLRPERCRQQPPEEPGDGSVVFARKPADFPSQVTREPDGDDFFGWDAVVRFHSDFNGIRK
jgi:hypothetical protein